VATGESRELLEVRVQPGASKTQVAGSYDGKVKIRLAARPVDGAANKELIRFLSAYLGIPRRSIELVSGLTSRTKRIRIEGMAPADVEKALLS
jgi:uncharacterized protein